MGVSTVVVWLALLSGLALQAAATSTCPSGSNQVLLGNYGTCTPPNPGQILAHMDIQTNPTGLPAGVTITCTSQVSLSTGDCTTASGCGAFYVQKTVVSSPISSTSASAAGQCPQSPNPPAGCGLIGDVSLSTAGNANTGNQPFDCKGYLTWTVLSCTASNGASFAYSFSVQMGANLFSGTTTSNGVLQGGFDGGGGSNYLGSNSCTQTISGTTTAANPTVECSPKCTSSGGTGTTTGGSYTASCTAATGTYGGQTITGLPISGTGGPLTSAQCTNAVATSFTATTNGLNCYQATGRTCAQCAASTTTFGSSFASIYAGGNCLLACQPNPSGYGSGVCQDPHFLAQGYNFNFTGVPEESYCLVSDDNLHINARIVGERPDAPPNTEGTQNGTWMDAIHITFSSKGGKQHTLGVIVDQEKDFEVVDCFNFELNGEIVGVPAASKENVFMSKTSPRVTITRRAGARAAAEVEIEGVALIHFDIYYDERIQLDPAGKFLNMYFKELLLGPDVHGVLGQFFAKDAKAKKDALFEKLSPYDYDNRGLVEGEDDEYKTTSLAATDCAMTRFRDPNAKTDVTMRRMMLSKHAGVTSELRQLDMHCVMEGKNLVCQ